MIPCDQGRRWRRGDVLEYLTGDGRDLRTPDCASQRDTGDLPYGACDAEHATGHPAAFAWEAPHDAAVVRRLKEAKPDANKYDTHDDVELR